MRAIILRALLPLLLFAFAAPNLAEAAPSDASAAVAKGKKKVKKAKRARRLSRRERRRRARAAARKRRAAARAAKKAARAKKKAPVAAAKKVDPRMVEAKRAFIAGRTLFGEKKWAEAIVEYKKAYAITQDGLVMGQVALGFEKAGDYKRALESIRVYRSALPESDRASVDEMIQKYEKLIADGKSTHLTLAGETPPEPPRPVVAAPVTPPPPKKEPKVARKKKGRFWTWVVLGGAAALAVSALVVGLSAQSKFDELNDGCKPNCSSSDVDSVRTRAVATDILWGTALAAGITAGVLYFLEGRGSRSGSRKRDDLKDVEEENDDLVKSFRVSPLVGAGTYGLGAEIRY